ncbi:MAG TPA: hypothetical protein VGL11_14170 [Candidatus Binatia bacterium]|jgi:hypothetical protein
MIPRSLLVVATALVLISGRAPAEESPLKQPLVAKLSLDRSSVSGGDHVDISATIKNSSAERITVYKKPRPYAIRHLSMSDEIGRSLKTQTLVRLALRPDTAEDFTELAPGEAITLTFPATLREDSGYDMKQGVSYSRGLLLHFGTSTIMIPQKGRYEIRFQYGVSKTMRDGWAQLFGFQNLWAGEIAAEPVPLTIK